MQTYIRSIVELRDDALMQTWKFQYDPHLGPAHENYLHKLNEIIDEYCTTLKTEKTNVL